MRIVVAALASLAVAACATSPEPADGPLSLAVEAGVPAPAQARFYADCIAQAAAAWTYDRIDTTIRFQCDGAPARAFYEGLAAWSASGGAEVTADGRTWRFTQKPQRDPSGLDYCWRESDVHRCTVVLTVGDYLER